jgi:Protein of unknown function (DUF2934)
MLNQRDKDFEGNVTPVKPRKTVSTPKAKPVKASSEAKAKEPVADKKSIAARPVKAKAPQAPLIAQQEIASDEVSRLAYLLWEARGLSQRAGSPEEDWLRAEALLRSGSSVVS